MKHLITIAFAGLVLNSVFAQNNETVTVGSAAMYPMRNIVENAINSKDHTTLVAAVKAADLVETLQSKGPFTVFAPTNDAFENLPEGTVATLLKPENKAQLQGVLTYHVIAGKYGFKELASKIKEGGGVAKLATVKGDMLSFKMNGEHNIMIWDAKGRSANITTYDVNQSNGVIHVIDQVLLP